MEAIQIKLTPEDFDHLVHCGTPEKGDLTVALKLDESGGTRKIAVAIGFTAVVDEEEVPVQAVTTAKLMIGVFAAIQGFAARHGIKLQ